MKRIEAVRQMTAARDTGIDSGQLARMIRSGAVQVVRTADGLALVPLAEVERLRAEKGKRKAGRPKHTTNGTK